MKYYYDDPLKAAWMKREFGIRLGLLADGGINELDDNLNLASLSLETVTIFGIKYAVYPDSYKIFEPQKGDLIKTNFYSIAGLPEGCSGLAVSIEELTEPFEEFLEDSNLEYESHVIIQREGKVFFMPKTES